LVKWSTAETHAVQKIVTGGQTGVDRAALDVAIALGLEHGGSCPKGRLAEDGIIDPRYRLTELPSKRYAVRTRQNVMDSDATLVLNVGVLDGGTAATVRYAERLDKPFLVVDLSLDTQSSARRILDWLRANQVKALNVAGPRESKRPGVYQASKRLLEVMLSGQT
jgi:hypothetical protein